MKPGAIAILAVATTFFAAGYVVGDDSARVAVASAVGADTLVAGMNESPHAEAWTHPGLPEGHPPILPEGHPPIHPDGALQYLPEGHPPLSGGACPYSGASRGMDEKPQPLSI